MRTTSFNRVTISIEKLNNIPTAKYKIVGKYTKKEVTTYTNDSSIYDYIDDDEQISKAREAARHAWLLLKTEKNR